MTQFYLESMFNGFYATRSKDISLKENANNFSVDYNAIAKPNMLNICKYLMVKNNIKQYSGKFLMDY